MPVTVLEYVTVAVPPPLHTVWFNGAIVITGVGLTVIVKLDVVGVAEQLLAVAVTIYVAVTAVLPVFTAVNDGRLEPDPLKPLPIFGLLVQLYVVPDTVLEKLTGAVVLLLHTDWLNGEIVITGVGLMVIVKLTDGPVQLFAVGTTI